MFLRILARLFFSQKLLLRWILRRRLRWLLRILRRRGGILSRLLTDRLAQSRSRLQARLSHSEIVLRGIPDKFEEAIIFCFLVNHDGRLVYIAPYSANVAAHNRWRVARRNCLGSRVTLIRPHAWSSCCCRICAGA